MTFYDVQWNLTGWLKVQYKTKEITRSLGCFLTTSAIFLSKYFGYTDPDGLDGEQRIKTLDFSLLFSGP